MASRTRGRSNARRLGVIIETNMATDEEDEEEVALRPKPKLVLKADSDGDLGDEVDSGRVGAKVRQSVDLFRKTFLPGHNIDEDEIFDGDLTCPTEPDFAMIYLTLRVLFWDLTIAVGDVVTDLVQGVALLTSEGTAVYGIITLAICWLPGFPAAIHLVSMYRNKLEWRKTLLFAFLLVVFYPIVPVLAYVNLLWAKPKRRELLETSARFREAEYFACIAHAITGGIESPVQLSFQLWMVLNGVITIDWSKVSALSFTDWQGNTFYLPIASSLTIIFSMVSILKATVDLNIIRVHIQNITTLSKGIEFSCIFMDHLPFLSTSAIFRVACMILCITYLSSFGFVPVIAVLVLMVVLAHLLYGRSKVSDAVPVWLTSFMAVFIPVCFTTQNIKSESDRKAMVSLQYNSFFYQSLIVSIVYGITLIAIFIVVMLPYSATEFAYSPYIVLDNPEFVAVIVGAGILCILTLMLSIKPTVSSMLCQKPADYENQVSHMPDLLSNSADATRQICTVHFLCSTFLFLLVRAFVATLVLSPVFVPFVYFGVWGEEHRPQLGHVLYKPASNHTVAVRCTMMNAFPEEVQGISEHFDSDPSSLQFYIANTDPTSPPPLASPSVLGYGPIAFVTRSTWESPSGGADLLSGAEPPFVGVVITDTVAHRPSSPLPDLAAGIDVPVMLVQKVDGWALPPAEYDGMIVWLTPQDKADLIPDPSFKCETEGCLQPVFVDGHIAGNQYRTKSCCFGNSSCADLDGDDGSSVRGLEHEPYCNGAATTVCPVGGYDFGIFRTVNVAGESRKLRSSPEACMAQNEFEADVVGCEWTDYLDWQVLWQDGDALYRSRRRYCYVVNSASSILTCLYEEQETSMCCMLQDGSCGPSIGDPC